jgi:hypothetical protein
VFGGNTIDDDIEHRPKPVVPTRLCEADQRWHGLAIPEPAVKSVVVCSKEEISLPPGSEGRRDYNGVESHRGDTLQLRCPCANWSGEQRMEVVKSSSEHH